MTGRPLPLRRAISAGYWEAARRHELAVQRCVDCGRYRHYPQELCPECLSSAHEWATLCGRGSIHSYVISHAAFHPYWKDKVPYVIATVEVEEGVRILSDLDEPPERVSIGAPVEVFFEELDEEITLPRFRLREP